MPENLYTLSYSDRRAWLWSGAFVAGNVAMLCLCHLIPDGGIIFLPIYFFTLIAAYKFGAKVGLATALASPLISMLLTGMPMVAMLPFVLVKGVLLAVSAAWLASYYERVRLIALLAVVLFYQIVGSFVEVLFAGSIMVGLNDFVLGWPGMLIQVFGGYAVLRYLLLR